MVLERKNILSFFIVSLLFASASMPAYAEVQSLQTDKQFYVKGDKITFSGLVDEDTTGLVTIVIRDSNDNFVLLSQTIIKPDNTYKKNVDVNDKFTVHGIYNATAFIYNMTSGALTEFDFSIDGSPVIPSASGSQSVIEEAEPNIEQGTLPQQEPAIEEESVINEEIIPDTTPKIAIFVDPNKDPQYYIDRYNNEPKYKKWFDRNYPELTIEEAVGLSNESEQEQIVSKIPGFPDPEKDSQYYIDRYNNEPKYKKWFDRNFPNQSIFEVVGTPDTEEEENDIQNMTSDEVISDTESLPISIQSSTVTTIDNEFSQMLLALGGLGILFGAVYGIKKRVDSNSEQIVKNRNILQKRVDHNSEQISQNRFWLKRKLMGLKPCDEPIKVIKERLAKGEITLDDYYKLLRALKRQ